MYYLTEKQRRACEYFASLETFTDAQAGNAIKFCCSVCGCNREEQAYMLEWYFDGYAADLVRFGNRNGEFWHLLNYCGDAWIVPTNDPEYKNYINAMFDGCQISGTILDPTQRLFVFSV